VEPDDSAPRVIPQEFKELAGIVSFVHNIKETLDFRVSNRSRRFCKISIAATMHTCVTRVCEATRRLSIHIDLISVATRIINLGRAEFGICFQSVISMRTSNPLIFDIEFVNVISVMV